MESFSFFLLLLFISFLILLFHVSHNSDYHFMALRMERREKEKIRSWEFKLTLIEWIYMFIDLEPGAGDSVLLLLAFRAWEILFIDGFWHLNLESNIDKRSLKFWLPQSYITSSAYKLCNQLWNFCWNSTAVIRGFNFLKFKFRHKNFHKIHKQFIGCNDFASSSEFLVFQLSEKCRHDKSNKIPRTIALIRVGAQPKPSSPAID